MKKAAREANYRQQDGTGSLEQCAYTFQAFFKKYNIPMENPLVRGEEVFVACPFHSDVAPSFAFNERKGICNCFSCTFAEDKRYGGTWLGFVLKYYNEVLGYDMGFYDLVESLMRDDPMLRATVGFNSIYDKQEYSATILEKKSVFRFNKEAALPTTYLELSTLIKERQCSDEIITLFILEMQDGIEPKEIYSHLFGEAAKEVENEEVEEPSFDFSEILNSEVLLC